VGVLGVIGNFSGRFACKSYEQVVFESVTDSKRKTAWSGGYN